MDYFTGYLLLAGGALLGFGVCCMLVVGHEDVDRATRQRVVERATGRLGTITGYTSEARPIVTWDDGSIRSRSSADLVYL